MPWKESDGEDWKGDNYQPPENEFYDEHDLIGRLANIFQELADKLNNPEPVDLDGPAPDNSFVLDGEIVRKPKNYGEYLSRFDMKHRRVCFTILRDGSSVSTVFLGLDHSFGEGTPILFETLGMHNNEEFCMKRYPTYEAALTGHRETVEELKIAIANDL